MPQLITNKVLLGSVGPWEQKTQTSVLVTVRAENEDVCSLRVLPAAIRGDNSTGKVWGLLWRKRGG